MSTRSAIIEHITDSGYPCYRGVYCHNDGYILGVGSVLYEHYQNVEKIHQLIDLGDLSSLDSTVENTRAYMRDRGEKECFPRYAQTWSQVAKSIDHNGYVYLFNGLKWVVYMSKTGERAKCINLKSAIKQAQKEKL